MASAAFKNLARTLRSAAREEVHQQAPPHETWRVTRTDPAIALERINGEGTLEEGDPDFDLSQHVREYHANTGLIEGDLVSVGREPSGDYVGHSVVSDTPVAAGP